MDVGHVTCDRSDHWVNLGGIIQPDLSVMMSGSRDIVLSLDFGVGASDGLSRTLSGKDRKLRFG